MSRKPATRLIFILAFLATNFFAAAQLVITEVNSAQQLAQRLLGTGVVISNPRLTAFSPAIIPTGFFENISGTNLGIDSGIVLTCGRAKTSRGGPPYGLNGNGNYTAASVRADEDLGLPGDPDLAAELGLPLTELNDAIALEFDFVPLGDTIRFNYVLSSEEYTFGTVCVYNDAFGFFISGPGISGTKNIALIPGTSIPVTITNVNNITTAGCVNYPQYYVDNTNNTFFLHEGHTTVFTAISRVEPCQTYHLKLVIADRTDHLWDSGVFLEAKSLNSNIPGLASATPVDNDGNRYLAEGCATGTITVRRPKKEATPLVVKLLYGGTAVNGTDIQLLPSSVTIPANDSIIVLPLIPLTDAIAEGNELLKVYTLAGCTENTVSDSAVIFIKDFDMLSVLPREAAVCKRDSVQLFAGPGYDSYQWNAHTLSDITIRNPFAHPVQSPTVYICTAMEGACARRDSSVVTIIPPVRIFAGNDTIASIGQPLQLQATAINGPAGMQYSWSPGQFLDDPLVATPIATLTEDYWYVVTGTTPDGCKEKDDIRIKVYKGPDIYVPSGFTPNNDGLNDILKPIAVGIRDFKFFRVFNRWGQLVFATTAPGKGWDGKIKGTEAGTSTFAWIAEGIDYKGNTISRKGVVTIIR